jgi:hypothetical protein
MAPNSSASNMSGMATSTGTVNVPTVASPSIAAPMP